MSLADELKRDEAERLVPAKYRNHFEIDGDTGTAATGLVDDALIKSNEDILRFAGLDPVEWCIDGKIHQWTKQLPSGGNLKSVFFGFRRVTHESSDAAKALAGLIKPVKARRVATSDGDPLVVCLADFQVGKVDHLGGTSELLTRFESVLGQVVQLVKELKPAHIVVADVGDCIEGITSSAPNQIATNDLTPDEQLRLWQRILTQTIVTLEPLVERLTVVGVPSNHAEVRNSGGKVGQGDYGISTLNTVRDAFAMLKPENSIEWVTPATEYDVVSIVQLGETSIAFTHGHHARNQSAFDQWLANQAASPNSPLNACTVAVHGHYHNYRYQRSTRGREVISCPTLDNGSSWFKNQTGEHSPPGLIVFQVADGRTTNLRCLEP